MTWFARKAMAHIGMAMAALTFAVSPIVHAGDGAIDTPAAPYQWRNVKVGGGGFAPGIVFSPAERGLAYLRTDMGGAYRWDARMGQWVPLQDGEAESSYMGVESIAPDPVDAAVVYMAAGMNARGPAAIFRSADRGAHWKRTDVPFSMGGNEDGVALASDWRSIRTTTAGFSLGLVMTGCGAVWMPARIGTRSMGSLLPGSGFPTGRG
ncbi:hypothetical protein [Sphingobium olei]|uniref:Exo-alpha-sialidase n=1 Tax=Sphingobium olei TaxID=420955 RepID=A0ABW3P0X1_9SPHN